MGLLANFKIRTKVLVALLPLVFMVLVAALYASIEMNTIDTRYSELIGRDVKALHNLTIARVMDNRFHQLLYQEIAEPNLDKMRSIDADLDKTAAEFYSSVDEAKRESPNLTSRIKTAQDLFDQAVSDSRPLRGAALMSDNTKAMQLMRGNAEPRLLLARQALIELADELDARVDQQSDELTARTHRTILITWIVIVLGLAASFAIALSIVQVEVVKVVLSFRSRILEVAEGRLDQPIANLDRPNEIGEMSRALQTLAGRCPRAGDTELGQSRSGGHHGAIAVGGGLPGVRQQSCCHGSRNPSICCTARSTSPTKDHMRFTRVGAFATDVSSGTAGICARRSLWWDKPLLSGARLQIASSADNPLQVSAGVATVTPACVLFVPVINQDVVLAVIELAPSAPVSERQQALLDAVATDGCSQHQDSGEQAGDQKAARANAGTSCGPGGGQRSRRSRHQSQVRLPRQHEP